MKIGIDASPLTIPFHCGTKNYSANLIKYLAKIDKNNEYFIFVSKPVEIPEQKNFKLVKTSNFLPVFKRQFFLSLFVTEKKLDIFHYLNPFGDIFLNHPRIITTIHDLNLSQTYPFLSNYFLNRIICEVTRQVVINRTNMFITPSKTIKEELTSQLKEYGNPSNNIHFIPEGVNENFKVDNTKLSSKKNDFLCLCDFAERKNTTNIIYAYSILPEKIKKRYKLKIISSTLQPAKKYQKIIDRMGLADYCEIYINVSLNKLIKLYQEAYCFLYPSYYEGFGLPILESMASGCPVITSNYGAMKEIAGKAALLINPNSISEISKAMIGIAENKPLYKELVQKSLKRADEFTWVKTAKSTLKIYETLDPKV